MRFWGIANQIAAVHMSRKYHVIYAQPHLTSMHGYVTELDKRRRGRSLFCCMRMHVWSVERSWDMLLVAKLLEVRRRG